MRAVITNIEGTTLTAENRELVQHPRVFGVIFFSRNYENPQQLKSLVAEIKKVNPALLFGVDQEGGPVQRFKEGFPECPAMQHFGKLYQQDKQLGIASLQKTVRAIAQKLSDCGINLNFAPVLDLNLGVSQVIGLRSFSSDPHDVAHLGSVVIETLLKTNILSVGKHFPGHGGVVADSHHELPLDSRDRMEVERGMIPFKKLLHKLPAVMPAHVVYQQYDNQPATFSRFWLQQLLRRELSYQGVIISDDLTMQAATYAGNYVERANLALESGCDLLTVCNNYTETVKILKELEKYHNPSSLQRIKQFRSTICG